MLRKLCPIFRFVTSNKNQPFCAPALWGVDGVIDQLVCYEIFRAGNFRPGLATF